MANSVCPESRRERSRGRGPSKGALSPARVENSALRADNSGGQHAQEEPSGESQNNRPALRAPKENERRQSAQRQLEKTSPEHSLTQSHAACATCSLQGT